MTRLPVFVSLSLFYANTRTMSSSLTWQLTAEQLHAQGAVPSADLGINAHVLGCNWRGEGAGGWSVVINIPSENLLQGIKREQTGGRGEADQHCWNVASDLSASPVTSPRLTNSRHWRLASQKPSKWRHFELRDWRSACGRNRGRRKEGEMCCRCNSRRRI